MPVMMSRMNNLPLLAPSFNTESCVRVVLGCQVVPNFISGQQSTGGIADAHSNRTRQCEADSRLMAESSYCECPKT
jgi:hypothetical protein